MWQGAGILEDTTNTWPWGTGATAKGDTLDVTLQLQDGWAGHKHHLWGEVLHQGMQENLFALISLHACPFSSL